MGYAPEFGIFEIGRAVTGMTEDNLCVEKKLLAITLYQKTENVKSLYFELRDILAVITGDIKHKLPEFKAKQPSHGYEHPVNLNSIVLDGKEIGTIGIVHPNVGRKIDKKACIVFAELDVQAFAEAETAPIIYEEPSKFPPIDYDISVVIPKGVLFSDMAKCWANEGKGILKSAKIVDSYDTDMFHSETVRFEFSSNERTLSSVEVQEIMDAVINNLKEIDVRLR